MLDGSKAFLSFFLSYYFSPMVANSAPVLVRGERRIDFGKVFADGRPIFGSNKTWEGLAVGLAMGAAASASVGFAAGSPSLAAENALASAAALLGDLLGAFFKRRLGLKPGDPAPVLDQLDFAVASTAAYAVMDPAFRAHWPADVLVAWAIIFLLHLLTNNLAYAAGLKSKRW